MGKNLYTKTGLSRLAEVVRRARGCMSYRQFQDATGVSHATIRRIEKEEVNTPEDATLVAIAPYTPYSFEELKAIATERNSEQVRSYRIAEDLLPYVNELPDIEAAKLAQIIVARLARMEVFLGEKPPADGLMLQVQLMNQHQMADILRAIANRLELPSD